MQTRLHKRMIQHGVVFATHHEGEACQIGEHRPGAILPIEPDQRALLLQLVCCQVPTDGCQSLAEFFSVEPVAAVPKRTEPLIAVGLADHGARTNHFSPFAPGVASRTDIIQSARGRWQFFCLG